MLHASSWFNGRPRDQFLVPIQIYRSRDEFGADDEPKFAENACTKTFLNLVQRPASFFFLLRRCRLFALDPASHDRGFLLLENGRVLRAGWCSLIEYSGAGTQQVFELAADSAICWVRSFRAVVRAVAIRRAAHPIAAGTIGVLGSYQQVIRIGTGMSLAIS